MMSTVTASVSDSALLCSVLFPLAFAGTYTHTQRRGKGPPLGDVLILCSEKWIQNSNGCKCSTVFPFSRLPVLHTAIYCYCHPPLTLVVPLQFCMMIMDDGGGDDDDELPWYHSPLSLCLSLSRTTTNLDKL
nr:hypothetical protein Iba_chr14cCG11610 [Ipomoea batatas]